MENKNRKIWSEGETVVFIDIWGENIENLRKAKRNGHIMAEMAQRLAKANIKVNSNEVLNKINNLTKKYRQEKKTGVSGGSPSDWPLYTKVHEIIGSFKSNRYDLSEETFSGSNIDMSNDSLFSDISDISIPSPTPSTSAFVTASTSSTSISSSAPTPRARKRKNSNNYDEIKHIIEKSSQIVADELKRSNDLLAEANKIENEKLKLVDSFVNTNIDFQKILLEMLQNEKK